LKLISPSFDVVGAVDAENMLKNIEACARVCYKSEDLITENSAAVLLRKILKSGHESVIEHEKITVRIICDRGISHEIVRHRIASFSQESTRYCNYSIDKFGNELTFIKPYFWPDDSEAFVIWQEQMAAVEKAYLRLIAIGVSPEQARSILPNSLKTELVVTMNLREWRHFFKLRTSPRAHPQMREITLPMLAKFKQLLPLIFDDIVTE
jgi:thymidylate synthase (FAD)